MQIKLTLNGQAVTADVAPETTLLEFLRAKGCLSVKCGCETTNCGLCTVWLDNAPILSCAKLAIACDGKSVTTIEGVQEEAQAFGQFLAAEGAEQCGFCSPGFVMSVLAMLRELDNPTTDDIKAYLAGNLCRCTGYMSQLRAIEKYCKAVHHNG